ncbi:MAG: glycosyltransferase family 4 protein [Litorimonas sp.]
MTAWPTPFPPQGIKEFITHTIRDILPYPSRWVAYKALSRPLWHSLMWQRRVNLLRSYISIGLPWDMVKPPEHQPHLTPVLKQLLKAHRLNRKSLIPKSSDLSQNDIWFKSAIALSHVLFDCAEGTFSLPNINPQNHRPDTPNVFTAPKRILYVSHAWPADRWNGYAIRTHKIALALAKHGIEVEVFCKPVSPHNLKAQAQKTPIGAAGIETMIYDNITYNRPVIDIQIDGNLTQYLQSYAKAIDDKITSYRPDIIHAASNFITGLSANIAAKAHALPIVYEVRGLWEITRLATHKAYERSVGFQAQSRLETLSVHHAAHVLTLNEPLRTKLVERGAARSKINLLPNCGDTTPPRGDLTHCNLIKTTCDFGYVGSLTDYEGLFLLIKAFEDCCKIKPNIQLIIAGDGPLTSAIIARIKASPFAQKIRYLEPLSPPDARALTKWLDVCVIARLSTPVTRIVPPLKPLTAFSVGTPCILSGLPALIDYNADIDTSLIVKAGNRKSLSAAMLKLAGNPNLRKKLGQNALGWVQKHRNWDVNAARLTRIYETLITET